MHTLFIDTHLWDIIIVLLKDGKMINKKTVIDKKNNSEYIFSTIVKVIDGVKLDEIIVVNGPGSFTGVRLGVTIAKTLAYTLNISLKTVTALECMAISNNTSKVAFSDSNGYYVGNFDESCNLISEYAYITNQDFTILNKKDEYYTDYNIDVEKIYTHLRNRENINPHQAKPIYIKKIGVEIDKSSK